MCRHRQCWILIVAVVLAAAYGGCRNGEDGGDPGQSNGQSGTNGSEKGTPNNGPPKAGNDPKEPPPKPTMPTVVMTEEHLKACLVRVGDTMPDAELPDLDGKAHPLAGLRGSKLTVICLWKSGESPAGELRALELLGHLQDLAEAFSQQGVLVVGINEGDPAEIVRKRVAGVTVPMLLDPEGAYFDKLATDSLPRVYLLDPEGKILWFDREFSLTTRRRLETGIKVALGEI